MRVLLLILLLLLPSAAFAVDGIGLGNLDVAASRIAEWYPVDPVDTSGWTVVNMTTAGGGAAPYTSCSNATGTGGGSDAAAIQCFVDNAPANTNLYLPDGTYNLTNGQAILIDASAANNIVFSGESRAGTIVQMDGLPDFIAGCKGSYSWFRVQGAETATTTAWTGNFTAGTTVLEVTDASLFSVGDWIEVYMDWDETLFTPPNAAKTPPNLAGRMSVYAVKVAGVDTAATPDTVTIDRALRYDFIHDTPGGENRKITKLNMKEGIGFENLTLDFASGNNNAESICYLYSAGGFVQDVDFPRYTYRAIRYNWDTARNLVFRSNFGDSRKEIWDPGFYGYAVHMEYSASDNHVHMNWFDADDANGVVIQNGSSGNVITYNYAEDCNNDGNRFGFYHGGAWQAENLFEGNEVNTCNLADEDNWYTPNGPRNTTFRNRGIGESSLAENKPQGLRSQLDDPGFFISSDPNHILNWVPLIYNGKACNGPGYPDGACNYIDYSQSANAGKGDPLHYTSDSAWFEKNVAFDSLTTESCTGDGVPYVCCQGAGVAKDVDGGQPASGLKGICPFGAAINPDSIGNNGDNFSANTKNGDATYVRTALPAAFSGETYPYSLVNGWNTSSVRPPGWCNEVTDWPALGADVDTYPISGLPKSPARRLADGDACTAYTGTGPTCGDGAVEGAEECDDNNTTPGDGCSATCTIEADWFCEAGDPSACHYQSICNPPGWGVTGTAGPGILGQWWY